MTGILRHMTAMEAVGLMWRDAIGLAQAPAGGFLIFCMIFGMPSTAVILLLRGRRAALIPLGIAAVCGGMWFAFYAFSAWQVLSPAGMLAMTGWLLLAVIEIGHRMTRPS